MSVPKLTCRRAADRDFERTLRTACKPKSSRRSTVGVRSATSARHAHCPWCGAGARVRGVGDGEESWRTTGRTRCRPRRGADSRDSWCDRQPPTQVGRASHRLGQCKCWRDALEAKSRGASSPRLPHARCCEREAENHRKRCRLQRGACEAESHSTPNHRHPYHSAASRRHPHHSARWSENLVLLCLRNDLLAWQVHKARKQHPVTCCWQRPIRASYACICSSSALLRKNRASCGWVA